MATHIPSRVHLKRLAPAIVSGLVVSFAFVAFFTSALHDPRPNALTVGIVGSPAAAAQTQRELDQALPGGRRPRARGSTKRPGRHARTSTTWSDSSGSRS